MVKLEPTKTITTADGTQISYWNGKMHNWDSFALIPQGNRKKGEYYLFGIKYSKLNWLAAKRDVIGEPPCKSSIYKNVDG